MRGDSFCKMLFILGASSLSLFQPSRSNAQAPAASDVPALTVLVRHAEYAPEPRDNPPLSAAGAQRAQDLAAALHDTKFSAIITSQMLRTRETAQPIAAAEGITPEVVPLDPANAGAYVETLETALRKHAGEAVLVVFHHPYAPSIIAGLGGPQIPGICKSAFDNLFVLARAAGAMQLVQSRYGAVSPTGGPKCK